ncbi:uncharacterized protein LOC114364714 isoform X5 [Ostrinia furnacalis]|uniref:uncharacterized protein LOC114364714 isoform X3 n=1 Tax=Ostrinia furnacalis TaxID=93504 RepID=UPI001038E7CB|nr:uncharacterized protein LOC114364714 isoform X3 [Ostrinia furnacalis]XP_028176780.1 uncharacterized protein LOC114364714 isoform X5 [Ostrinia furnacalis]
MSETRKNHLSIDGGQVKGDDNVATYKPIPDADSEYLPPKTVSKSKEKISDEAEEKLLDKEEEAKIVTRVDMADAKYVVGDHRNGDAKIELDANKRQFSGLTKEELLKYADDPFWVRLRWCMFALFWALWLCMLAGAIAIIVRAPKCAAPAPKTWYEKGPLVDASGIGFEELETYLPLLKSSKAAAVFADVGPTYDVLDSSDLQERFKKFVAKAKENGVKVIVDLTPNYVSVSHDWFQQSVNRTPPYDAYFTWTKPKEYVEGSDPVPVNSWVSTQNTSAWEWNEDRKEFYLHQYESSQADLNFHNPAVVQEFDRVLKTWMQTGAAGVRLHKVRLALVDPAFPPESAESPAPRAGDADHTSYPYWRHTHTSDQPGLDNLLTRWAKVVDDNGPEPGAGETVFTLAEPTRPELFQKAKNVTLRPLSAAPLSLSAAANVSAFVGVLQEKLKHWPAMKLTGEEAEEVELAELALLLPAAPVLALPQLAGDGNDTSENEKLSHLVSLRNDASVEHGDSELAALRAVNSTQLLLACARWKQGHTGYVAVHNPGGSLERANLTLSSVPAALSVHHVSRAVRDHTNYTSNMQVHRDNVLVPAHSTVVLSYVPLATTKQ